MGNEIKIFLTGIANSLNTDGYYRIVTAPKNIGTTTTIINSKRKKHHKRMKKVVDERISELIS